MFTFEEWGAVLESGSLFERYLKYTCARAQDEVAKIVQRSDTLYPISPNGYMLTLA